MANFNNLNIEDIIKQSLLNQQTQSTINSSSREITLIVAVDNMGGFSKNKQIPWNYPQDLHWFKMHTNNQICIMGRNTYNEINQKIKNETSVLPDRECYVVSNTLSELPNAKVIKHWRQYEQHTDLSQDKKVMIIGGDKLYRECIAVANKVIITIVNNTYDCDMFFPTEYLYKYFNRENVYKVPELEELRFAIFKRKQQ